MKKNIFIFISLFFCFSCPCFAANYEKMVNHITSIFVKEFTKPRGLYLSGSGGAMMYDVEKVILNFLSFETLTVDEARILYVEMMEEFLTRINQNDKIRPYLHNYPFEPKNFELSIGFEDMQRKIKGDGSVALIFHSNRHKKLFFEAYDQSKEKFYELHQEPYEESRRIVQELNQSCLNPK